MKPDPSYTDDSLLVHAESTQKLINRKYASITRSITAIMIGTLFFFGMSIYAYLKQDTNTLLINTLVLTIIAFTTTKHAAQLTLLFKKHSSDELETIIKILKKKSGRQT